MPIIAANNGGGQDFAKAPEGQHVARCYRVIQLGTITKQWQGEDKQIHEIRIDWELPNELHVFNEEKGEEPFTIGATYTLSLGDKAKLRSTLESWRGKKFTDEELKGFDVSKLIGAPCLVNIAHAPSKKDPSKTYADVLSVSPIVKGMTVPPAILTPVLFEFDNFDWEVYEGLSDHWKTRIANSKEYGEKAAERAAQQRENASRTHGAVATPPPAQTMEEVENDLPF